MRIIFSPLTTFKKVYFAGVKIFLFPLKYPEKEPRFKSRTLLGNETRTFFNFSKMTLSISNECKDNLDLEAKKPHKITCNDCLQKKSIVRFVESFPVENGYRNIIVRRKNIASGIFKYRAFFILILIFSSQKKLFLLELLFL